MKSTGALLLRLQRNKIGGTIADGVGMLLAQNTRPSLLAAAGFFGRFDFCCRRGFDCFYQNDGFADRGGRQVLRGTAAAFFPETFIIWLVRN